MSTTTNAKENSDITTNPSPEDTGSQLGEKLYGPLGEWVSCDREKRGVIVIIADAGKTTSMTIGRGGALANSLAATMLADGCFREVNNIANMAVLKKTLGNP
nr:MAG TPA: hypothetical protein [Caudoviricetes sp.]